MPGKTSILITATISAALINELIAKDLEVDIIPFIQTNAVRTEKIQLQVNPILSLNATIVFTSNNAVHAVAEYLQNLKPNWRIYCIGNTTKALAEAYFGKDSIVATANDGTALANKIIARQKPSEEVYFFCGDKRRDDLPALLKQNNFTVNEIEVYTTTILTHSVEKTYDGILFFSPSAVQGFFDSNALNDTTVLFAIGNTTGAAIKQYTGNRIVISDKPGKKELIGLVIDYFKGGN